MDLRIALTV